MRLAEIPDKDWEQLLAEGRRTGVLTTDRILRVAGKLNPDRPRPHERARIEALNHLDAAMGLLDRLRRKLREAGTPEEETLAFDAFEHVARALRVLYQVTQEE